jgi:hypothetical protein
MQQQLAEATAAAAGAQQADAVGVLREQLSQAEAAAEQLKATAEAERQALLTQLAASVAAKQSASSKVGA